MKLLITSVGLSEFSKCGFFGEILIWTFSQFKIRGHQKLFFYFSGSVQNFFNICKCYLSVSSISSNKSVGLIENFWKRFELVWLFSKISYIKVACFECFKKNEVKIKSIKYSKLQSPSYICSENFDECHKVLKQYLSYLENFCWIQNNLKKITKVDKKN